MIKNTEIEKHEELKQLCIQSYNIKKGSLPKDYKLLFTKTGDN